MGFFKWRREKFRALLKELEALLKAQGITPSHLFGDRNLLNYLACVPFNRLLDSWNLTTVNIDLAPEEMQFVQFILIYRKLKNRKENLLLDTPPDVLYHDSPIIGWRENTRYQEELERYRQRMEEYEYRLKEVERKRRELLESFDGEVFRYVEKEMETTRCSVCGGSGRRRVTGNDAPETTLLCHQCRGSGKSGYLPRVSQEQRRKAEDFRKRLQAEKEPVFDSFPCKRKPVYLRLTHEGQLFFKTVPKKHARDE